MSGFDLFLSELANLSVNVERNFPISSYTTMAVGGNTEFFVHAQDVKKLEKVITLAFTHSIPFKVIGKGSNIIVADDGYKGLIIFNNTSSWQILDTIRTNDLPNKIFSRFETNNNSFHTNPVFALSVSKEPNVTIRVDSGIRVNTLMKQLYNENIVGLEWFNGIPGSVGGAIYMNMHGGSFYFSNLVEGAYITDGINSRYVDHSYFKFDYDWSILHQTKEIVLQADLCLNKGDVQKAKELAKEWALHKAQQPKRSAGCVFQNLSPAEQKRHDFPTPSTGYLVDKVLQLKGKRIGDAIISPKHAAFVENLGQATAKDVYALICLVKQKAKEKLNIDLKLEVELLGKFEAI